SDEVLSVALDDRGNDPDGSCRRSFHRGSASAPSLHPDPEQLLPHEQHVVVPELLLAAEADEGAVGAAEVGEPDLALVGRDHAVQAGDVAVLGEGDVAAPAADVEARLGDREGVAASVAPGHERDAADVPLGGAAETLDPVGRGRLRRERLEADDLLPDTEDVA